MLVTIIVTVLNTILLSVSKATRLPGFDLLPAGMLLIGASGEPVLLGSALLIVPFFILSAVPITFAWTALPVMLFAGFLAGIGVPLLLCLFIYYLISVVIAVIFGQIGPKFGLFLLINASLNSIIIVLGKTLQLV